MEILSLAYAGVATRDPGCWTTLGPEVYGFELAPQGEDGSVYLRMDDRSWRLALHPADTDELSYIGWEVRGRIEFEQAVAELRRRNIEATVAGPELVAARRVSQMVYFHDPAGFRHEIFFGQEFLPGSFRPGRGMSGFVAGNLGLGHLVVAVPEVTDEIRHFATTVLGFKIFAGFRTVGPRGDILGLEFYRCNRRSHCFAYVPAGDLRGLTHIGVEVNTLDDVGIALDMIQERNIPIKMSLGRHTADSLVSFYIRSPSGFEFEYGTFGQEIDEDFVVQKPQRGELWGHKFMLKGWGSTVKPAVRQTKDAAA
jgi:extradiol dioxygenase